MSEGFPRTNPLRYDIARIIEHTPYNTIMYMNNLEGKKKDEKEDGDKNLWNQRQPEKQRNYKCSSRDVCNNRSM